MNKAFLHPLFLTSALLFLMHQGCQKVWGISLPWIDSYLDPLLCMPLLLAGYEWEQRWLFGRKALPLSDILIVIISLAVVFEVVFPSLSSRFTTDAWDVAAYFAGGFLYFRFRG